MSRGKKKNKNPFLAKVKEFYKKFCAFWQKNAQRKFWFRFLCAFLATVLVVGGVAWGLFAYFFGGINQDEKIDGHEAGITKQEYHDDKLINIALFGIDSRDKTLNGRSDSIVIVTLDSKRKEIRLSAIERDTYVEIEGRGKDKINHAYAFGGPQLAVKTLNQNFNLDIKDYAVINFANMVKVVDALGGIRMEVPQKYMREVNKWVRYAYQQDGKSPIYIQKSGEQLLNGYQALGMARARKTVGGTNARANMHEEILMACYRRVKEKSILEYPKIVKELFSLVQTTLTVSEATSMGTKVATGNYTIKKEVFPLVEDHNPSGGSMINGIWYRTYNEEEGKKHLIDFVYQSKLPEDEKEKE